MLDQAVESSPPAVPTQHSTQKTALYGILGVVLLLLVGATSYYLGQQSGKQSTQPAPLLTTPTIYLVSPTPDETAGWESFILKEAGIAFNYPKDWVVSSNLSSVSVTAPKRIVDGEEMYFTFSVLNRPKSPHEYQEEGNSNAFKLYKIYEAEPVRLLDKELNLIISGPSRPSNDPKYDIPYYTRVDSIYLIEGKAKLGDEKQSLKYITDIKNTDKGIVIFGQFIGRGVQALETSKNLEYNTFITQKEVIIAKQIIKSLRIAP